MHEVWLWEQKLDAEEAEAEDASREQQAAAGAEHRRGRSPLSQELDNDADEVERRYGVSPPKLHLETTSDAAARTLKQDRLTAELTIKKAESEEELLPCHYFDFMYGTSTGGLIATILGRLRMTVTEALELYRKVGDDLFGRRRSSVPLMTKYYHEPLERAVKDIVGSRCHEHPNCDGENDMHPWDTDHFAEILQQRIPFDVDRPRVCQTCCLTATHDENIVEAYLLRSYPHYYSENTPNFITVYNEGADVIPIWAVTRATTAAPFYFEMITQDVNGETKSFKDGGIRENNPSGAALSEFRALYEGKADRPALLLSVGTGKPDQNQDGFASAYPGPLGRIPFVSKFLEKRAIVQNLLIRYTDGEKQHHFMREHAQGEHTWYKRLNVSEGLESMPLDDWKKGEYSGKSNVAGGASLTRMEDVTTKYLDREYEPSVDSYAPPSIMLRQAAEKLVRQRRAREQEGGARWDAFVGKHLHHQPQGTDVQGKNPS